MSCLRVLKLTGAPARNITAVRPRIPLARSFHGSRAAHKHYLDATPEVFEKHVLQAANKEKLVIVDFYADWCGPCKMISPHLEKLTSDTAETGGKEVDLVTVDVDAQPDLAIAHKIKSLPTVVAFRGGVQVGQFIGALPPPQLKKMVDSWL
ncbi:hypothetical protein FRB95_011576 [Tulasnella sp. JGI-2019a]|nr:hypothetical protein FRB93_004800 [Tulasnella sp. JGI-2019a]KAG9035281.1 hypothetical protein FRB95_011576 [Tulasnella sp. JGI-2019a]